MANIYTSSYPYELHGISVENALDNLEHLFKTRTHPEEIAAMIVEPTLGEGGYLEAPKAFLDGLRGICDEHGILLIVDEVQTGFGRCGRLFACEGLVQPDILVVAKGLASGFPLSAVVANNSLTDMQEPGSMGGTYAGNAVSCAAALATIRVIEEENLVTAAQERGEQLKQGLEGMAKRHPIVRDIRGPGCMVGVQLDAKTPPGTNKKLSLNCLDEDLLLLAASVYPTVRFIPPLTVSQEEIDIGLDRFEKALKKL